MHLLQRALPAHHTHHRSLRGEGDVIGRAHERHVRGDVLRFEIGSSQLAGQGQVFGSNQLARPCLSMVTICFELGTP